MTQTPSFFAISGGLDLVTPAISVPGGRARAANNYEPAPKGYQRIDGYERFDGQPKPSDASYWVLNFDGGTAAITEGQVVTGVTSGATGKALIDGVVQSGAYGTSDAAGYLVLTNVTGTFVDNESLQVSAVTKCVANGTAIERGATTDANDTTWLRDAIETARSLIQTVPGSGRVRGVWVYKGVTYAVRDNAGGTAGVLHKATTAGWAAQSLGWEAAFTSGGFIQLAFTSGGTTPIAVGNSITGATSGATGTVSAVTVTSGSWAGGDAAGTLTLSAQTGIFVAEDLNVSASTNLATVAGNSTVTPIAEGNTITGATSGATATVGRVIVASGTWAAGTAAGRLILTAHTGAFVAENLNIGSSLNVATISGAATANALPAGGRYEFANHNFFGASNLERMYGCNGVGKAFEWDGSVFVPIVTGMATDTPKHIAIHKQQLFLAFAGGSIQHSGPGEPYDWSPVLGAGEIGIGEEVTGMLPAVSGVMAIFGRNKISMLYGDDAANWDLKPLADEAGAVEWTAQTIGAPVYLDDRGIRSLTATQTYGDFRMGTMSALVEPIFKAKRANGVTAVASVRLRTKDQYRLFWSDGTALAMYVGRKHPEIMPLDYDGMVVRCTCVGEDADGREIAFFGSDNGYVYQLDSGTSFDGGTLGAYARLAYNHVGSPRQDKRWHGVALELSAAPSTNIGITAEFSYGNPDQPAVQEESFTVAGGGGAWNEAEWNSFYWSAPAEGVAWADIDGIGTNISVVVVSESIYDEPHTLHGMTLYHSPRRLMRN